MKSEKSRVTNIVMDRIRPRAEQNILLREGLPLKLTPVCYDIGVCGAYLRYSIVDTENNCTVCTDEKWSLMGLMVTF